MKWADVLQPSIDLAEKGFVVTYTLARSLKSNAKLLEQFPESKRIFLRDGNPFQEATSWCRRSWPKR